MNQQSPLVRNNDKIDDGKVNFYDVVWPRGVLSSVAIDNQNHQYGLFELLSGSTYALDEHTRHVMLVLK